MRFGLRRNFEEEGSIVVFIDGFCLGVVFVSFSKKILINVNLKKWMIGFFYREEKVVFIWIYY